ncbi:CPBP family glutamic-type intramembrane protease [Patiriisocius marinus]|nr:CPBP family glutamic-type intramembrane protease [Patiriisocius marinus]
MKFVVAFFFFKILSLITIIFISKLGFFDYPLKGKIDTFNNLKIINKLIIGVLIAPILEELLFRLSLIYSKFNISITLTIFSYYIVSKFLGLNIFEFENIILRIFIAISAGYFCFKILNNSIKIDEKLKKTFSEYNRSIVYFSILLFAFSHLFNYDLTYEIILYSPLILLPQFISSIFYSYARLYKNIFYSITLHSLTNSVNLVIPLLIKFL